MVGLLFWLALAVLPVEAALPDYARNALNHFSPEVPAGWSYTLATTRNGRTMLERFDPARPPAEQWTLLQWEGRVPTDGEREKYAQSRPGGTAGGPQANFQRTDIDPGSLALVREDEERAEFQGRFREESTGADKMLGHLGIRLTISKRTASVEKYSLDLTAPYTPVLAVKMSELQVEASFSPPAADRPSLPARQVSHFAGRILFISTAEQLEVVYSDFARTR